jgi:hypothetical protein
LARNDLGLDGVRVVRLENTDLQVDVAPEVGGRVVSLIHKALDRAFLWRNAALPLRRAEPGAPYDPNFYGGIDEVIPCDLPETIGGIECPDHGELWTLPLAHRLDGAGLVLEGTLPRVGLHYRKQMRLRPDAPWLDMDYTIENRSGAPRAFLWKLHAALAAAPGDRLDCPARNAVVADPRWSRWKDTAPFPWPVIDGTRADILPSAGAEMDFLFLYDLTAGRVALEHPAQGGRPGATLAIEFDPRVFPYVTYFASYGGFDGHYTAVLEPATAMPLSVNEAGRLGQCSYLAAGAQLTTRISIYAGPLTV